MLVVSKSPGWKKKKNFDKDNFSELLFYKDGECKLSREMDCSIIDCKLSNFI